MQSKLHYHYLKGYITNLLDLEYKSIMKLEDIRTKGDCCLIKSFLCQRRIE